MGATKSGCQSFAPYSPVFYRQIFFPPWTMDMHARRWTDMDNIIYWLMFYGTNGGWQVVWGLQLLRWVVEWFCLVVFLMCVVKALVNPSPSCCIVYIEGVGAV